MDGQEIAKIKRRVNDTRKKCNEVQTEKTKSTTKYNEVQRFYFVCTIMVSWEKVVISA